MSYFKNVWRKPERHQIYQANADAAELYTNENKASCHWQIVIPLRC